MSALSFCTLLKLLREEMAVETNMLSGVVMLRRGGMDTRYFSPSANTNAARRTALQAAMAVAATDLAVDAQVTLLYGQFAVDAGEPITSYAPANAVIVFGPGSSVLYADEEDAQADHRMFPGQVRYAKNFGAGTDVADNQPRFQAALFSMPPRSEPVYQPTKYPDLQTRTGVLYLEETTYDILDSIWITGYQSIIGETGRESVIALPDGFAPDAGDEKFGIETACYKPGGGGGDPELQTGSNFSFSIRLLNLQIANESRTNTKASGIRYGCGQGGEIKVITSAMGSRGIVLLGNTCHITVHHLGVADASLVDPIIQTGPHLSGVGVYGCRFTTVSEERLNDYLVADHLDYTIGGSTVPLACIMFASSRNLRFESCAGESNGNYMYLKACHGTKIGNIDHQAAETLGHGGYLVWFDGCINAGFESVRCRYFEDAYKATGFGESRLGVAASDNFPAGPFNTTGDTFIAIAGAPTVNHVPANCSRDILDTGTGIAERWINNGGVLQSIPYA